MLSANPILQGDPVPGGTNDGISDCPHNCLACQMTCNSTWQCKPNEYRNRFVAAIKTMSSSGGSSSSSSSNPLANFVSAPAPHPLSLPHSPAPPPPASHTDDDDADFLLGLPEALFNHYSKSKENMGDGEKALINERLMALDDLTQNAAKIVHAPKPLSVNPKYQEIKNVAGVVRKRVREGKLLGAIEALTSAMAIPVSTITIPKRKFLFI